MTTADDAGNLATSPSAPVLPVTIVTVSSDYSGNWLDYPPGASPAAGPVRGGACSSAIPAAAAACGIVQPTAPSNVPIWFTNGQALGTATDIPMQGDFDGDGKMDLVTYNLTTAIWTVSRVDPRRIDVRAGDAQVVDLPGEHARGRQLRRPWCQRVRCLRHRQRPGRSGPSPPRARGAYGALRPGDDGRYPRGWATTTGWVTTSWPSTGPPPASSWSSRPAGTVETITIPGLTPNANLVPVPAQYDNAYYYSRGQAYRTEAAVFDPTTGVFTIASPTSTTGAYYRHVPGGRHPRLRRLRRDRLDPGGRLPTRHQAVHREVTGEFRP